LWGPPPPTPYTYMYSYTEVVFTFGFTTLYIHKDTPNCPERVKLVRYTIE